MSARRSVAPERIEKPDSVTHDTEFRHPAFGQVTVHHWNSSGRHRMYGSDLGHSSGLTITVTGSVMYRGLSYDRHHSQDIILEFDLTEAQWARFVASTGNGGGVPVTLRHKRTGPLEELPSIAAPEASKREVHGKEMASALKETLATAQAVADEIGQMLSSPGSVSKTRLKELHHDLELAVSHLPGSVRFIYDQFAKATEKVAEDAKLEIEAHVAGVATQLGLEHLRNMAPTLEYQDSPQALEQTDGRAV